MLFTEKRDTTRAYSKGFWAGLRHYKRLKMQHFSHGRCCNGGRSIISIRRFSGPVLQPVCRRDHFIASVSQFCPPAGFFSHIHKLLIPLSQQGHCEAGQHWWIINTVYKHYFFTPVVYVRNLWRAAASGITQSKTHPRLSEDWTALLRDPSGRLRKSRKSCFDLMENCMDLCLIELSVFNYRLQTQQMMKNILNNHNWKNL